MELLCSTLLFTTFALAVLASRRLRQLDRDDRRLEERVRRHCGE